MAAIDKAGRVGVMTFNGLDLVLGIGYYLLPVVLVVLAILFFCREMRKKMWALTQIIGAIALFISGLGLINIAFVGKGGFWVT